MATGRMPLCACGHAWGDHAMDSHMDYDIDDGKRPCFALTDSGECRCVNYNADLMDALKMALPPQVQSSSLLGRGTPEETEEKALGLPGTAGREESDAMRLQSQPDNAAIWALALEYHRTVEGEYGCPGVECPGVKRLHAFALRVLAGAPYEDETEDC